MDIFLPLFAIDANCSQPAYVVLGTGPFKGQTPQQYSFRCLRGRIAAECKANGANLVQQILAELPFLSAEDFSGNPYSKRGSDRGNTVLKHRSGTHFSVPLRRSCQFLS
jgi:hypothetical protein